MRLISNKWNFCSPRSDQLISWRSIRVVAVATTTIVAGFLDFVLRPDHALLAIAIDPDGCVARNEAECSSAEQKVFHTRSEIV